MSTFAPTIDKRDIAHQTARTLLEIGAIEFNADQPFMFSSGWASPVYVDCRRIISYPRVRTALMDFSASTILTEIGYEALDMIAGGESAGIPFAAWIAERLMLPMQYIRKNAKGFGRTAQIEGNVQVGGRALLVEDLTTDGRSKANFANALRTAGARVEHCFVLFYYDIFPMSRESMQEINLTMHHLATWWDVLEAARASNHFDPGVLKEIEGFLQNPGKWSAAHGGIAALSKPRMAKPAV
jgi:orotate phosphoribosyltransferase